MTFPCLLFLWPTVSFCGALVFSRACVFTHPHISSPLPSVWALLILLIHLFSSSEFSIFLLFFYCSVFLSFISFSLYSLLPPLSQYLHGHSHKLRVVWFPNASSWACLGKASPCGLTLPLCFCLSLDMVDTRRSHKLSHCPRDISLAWWDRGNEGMITGEGGSVLLSEFPSSPHKASSTTSLPFLGGCSVPAPFPACKGAILVLPVPSKWWSWQQLDLVVHSEPCFCLQGAIPIAVKDIYL